MMSRSPLALGLRREKLRGRKHVCVALRAAHLPAPFTLSLNSDAKVAPAQERAQQKQLVTALPGVLFLVVTLPITYLCYNTFRVYDQVVCHVQILRTKASVVCYLLKREA